MIGDERPSNVFDAAMSLFVKRYELTVHQRLTRTLSMSGLSTSQWMARFRHAGGEWTAKMSSDGLFYASCHRHYKQLSSCLRRNYQWTSCCRRQTDCTSRYPPRLFQPSRKCQPNWRRPSPRPPQREHVGRRLRYNYTRLYIG